MISQLTIFLANEKGRLASATRTIADAGINMSALFLADTVDFGVARIFCDYPQKAVEALKEAGYRAALTQVLAVRVPNRPGGLADLLEFFHDKDVNIEYGYCFATNKEYAIDVLKVEDPEIENQLVEAGFELVAPEEIYALD